MSKRQLAHQGSLAIVALGVFCFILFVSTIVLIEQNVKLRYINKRSVKLLHENGPQVTSRELQLLKEASDRYFVSQQTLLLIRKAENGLQYGEMGCIRISSDVRSIFEPEKWQYFMAGKWLAIAQRDFAVLHNEEFLWFISTRYPNKHDAEDWLKVVRVFSKTEERNVKLNVGKR